MRRYLYTLPALLSLMLIQCGGKADTEKASDGRTLSFEDTIWESCQASNEMASFRIEYESGMDQVSEDDEDVENVFKQYCHEVNGAVWCETGSPADNILASLSDDIRHKMSTCCYQANGSFFKTATVNKYYNVVEVTGLPEKAPEAKPEEKSAKATTTEQSDADDVEEKEESKGFWSSLFGSDDDDAEDDNNSEDEEEATEDEGSFFSGWFSDDDGDHNVGVVKDASDSDGDKPVTLYHKSFDPKNFGTCHQK